MINNRFSNSIYFKEIFSDIDEFKTYVTARGETPNEIDELMFSYIYDNYCNSSIAFDTKDAFKRRFGNIYFNKRRQYQAKHARIQTLYDLTDGDLVVLHTAITNLADSPSTLITGDTLEHMVNHIDSQTQSKLEKNKLDAILKFIQGVTEDIFYDVIKDFRKLFFVVFPNSIEIY